AAGCPGDTDRPATPSESRLQLNPISFSLVVVVFVAVALATMGFAAPPRVAPAVAAPAAAPVELQVPVIVRSDWTPQTHAGARTGQVDDVVIHHFWRPSLDHVAAPADEMALLRQVERSHLGKGWSGLAYNFVVFQSGRVYEVRGWGREGAHTKGVNAHSVGIAFAIDGDRVRPTDAAWQAAKDLIEDGVAAGHLGDDVHVSGHNEHAAKACPGRHLVPHLHDLEPATA
ncbi:MAG: N-acetylmuramoyl-L-alanine amidase, partial [Actinobacteria bacterium]|nr:N-acetylmuramoyl-L-alanine amidase [Actinomycetota bacterium]